MTGVEADETVEVVAPCIMGTFIQAFQTKDRGRGCGREGGGEGTGMIWLPWQNVQDQKSWHKSSDIAGDEFEQVSRHMQDRDKKKRKNIDLFYKIKEKARSHPQMNKQTRQYTIIQSNQTGESDNCIQMDGTCGWREQMT